MYALSVIAQQGKFGFLASLLEMEYAERDVSFSGLKIVSHVTEWDEIVYSPRTTKYALEQKARRARIGFGELGNYFTKENRNTYLAENSESRRLLEATSQSLQAMDKEAADFNQSILEALRSRTEEKNSAFKYVLSEYKLFDNRVFEEPKNLFKGHMDAIAEVLSEMWEDDRYVRQIGES